jgi:hypothetical protein
MEVIGIKIPAQTVTFDYVRGSAVCERSEIVQDLIGDALADSAENLTDQRGT